MGELEDWLTDETDETDCHGFSYFYHIRDIRSFKLKNVSNYLCKSVSSVRICGQFLKKGITTITKHSRHYLQNQPNLQALYGFVFLVFALRQREHQ